jgi:peptide chain release factor 2
VAIDKLAELNALAEDPALWNDSVKAQTIMRERNTLSQRIDVVKKIEATLTDNIDLIEMGEVEGDAAIVAESEKALIELRADAAKKELESLLSGEADGLDAYLEVNAGAGGTEAQDWASMLLRMYIRWAEQHDYKVDVLDQSDGEEAGIKSATIQIKGPNAYGWLKSENGVHRLVRISPFDSNARRHTSFASLSISPVVDDTINIEILEKDLKVDTYRASGSGGQHVNRTDSAVRITHLPSGIIVACQNDRSQHANRANAMNMLRSRLYEAEMQRREDVKSAAHGEKTDIGFGHQIRSYVLAPYQLVKDLRTNVETNQSDNVLDGDIDMFLEASLAARLVKED